MKAAAGYVDRILKRETHLPAGASAPRRSARRIPSPWPTALNLTVEASVVFIALY